MKNFATAALFLILQFNANNTSADAQISLKIPGGTHWIQTQIKMPDGTRFQYHVRVSGGVKNTTHTLYYRTQQRGNHEFRIWAVQDIDIYYPRSTKYLASKNIHIDSIENIYLKPSARVPSDDLQIKELAFDIIENASTDHEKALAIHDWVATHIEYDVEVYRRILSGGYDPTPSNALTVLETQKSICHGISALFAALARAAGIPSRIVRGMISYNGVHWTEHDWNEVYLDGRWQPVDVTWDSGHMTSPPELKWTPKLQHRYFLPNPVDFSRDHKSAVPLLD